MIAANDHQSFGSVSSPTTTSRSMLNRQTRGVLIAVLLSSDGCKQSEQTGPERSPTTIAATPRDAADVAAAKTADPVAERTRPGLLTYAALTAAAAEVATAAEREALTPFLLLVRDDTQPLVRAIDEAVKDWPESHKREALAFLLEFPAYQTLYRALIVESLAGPPAFAPHDGTSTVRSLVPELFAARERMGRLLAHSYSLLQQENANDSFVELWRNAQLPPERIDAVKRDVLTYLNANAASLGLPPFDVVVDPAMTPTTGANAQVGSRTVLLMGPTPTIEAAEMVLAHEFAHRPLWELVRRHEALAEALRGSRCAFAHATTLHGYDTWESYLLENLVRNISYRVPRVLEHRTDFVFEAFFDAELRAYENGDEPFTEFLAGALQRLREQFCPG